jgi:hypothetical protein
MSLAPADSKSLLIGVAVVGVPSALWLLSRTRRPAGPAPNDFESFLKQRDTPGTTDQAPVSANSFEAFLRAPGGQQGAAAAGPGDTTRAAAAAAPTAAVPSDRAPVTVLFGTEYGFSKEIAEKLAGRLEQTEQFWWVLCFAVPSLAVCGVGSAGYVDLAGLFLWLAPGCGRPYKIGLVWKWAWSQRVLSPASLIALLRNSGSLVDCGHEHSVNPLSSGACA